jgi:hypothetical protein
MECFTGERLRQIGIPVVNATDAIGYECEACSEGRFADTGTNQANFTNYCKDCAEGKYQNREGRTQCNDAQPQNYVFMTESGAQEELKCPASIQEDTEAKCGHGMFEFRAGYWHDGLDLAVEPNCTNCVYSHMKTARSGNSSSSRCCWDDDKESFEPCGVDYNDCNYFINEYTQFYMCMGMNRTCRVEPTTGTVSCAPGNWGVLCGKCRKGYVMGTTGECATCSQVDDTIAKHVLLLMLGLLLFTVFLSGCFMVWFRATTRYITRVYMLVRDRLISRMKMLIVFYQICLLMGKVFQVPFPVGYLEFLDQFAFLQFNIFNVFRLGCLYEYQFHEVFYAVTQALVVIEITIVVMLFVLMVAHDVEAHQQNTHVEIYRQLKRAGALEKKNERAKYRIPHYLDFVSKARDRACTRYHVCASSAWELVAGAKTLTYRAVSWIVMHGLGRVSEVVVGNMLLIVYFIYPYCCQLIFSTFMCREIDGVSYLQEDLAVRCDSEDHEKAKVWAWVMVALFPVGVPLLLFGMLYPHRDHILIGATHNIWYLRFFFDEYDVAFFYWESVESIRKCVLMGFSSLFKPGTIMQLVMVMVITVLYICVITRTQPYKRDADDIIAVFTNIMVFVVLLGSLMMKFALGFRATGVWENGYDVEVVEKVLISATALVFIACMYYVFRDLWDIIWIVRNGSDDARTINIHLMGACGLPMEGEFFVELTINGESCTPLNKQDDVRPKTAFGPSPKFDQHFTFTFPEESETDSVCVLQATVKKGKSFLINKKVGEVWIDVSHMSIPAGRSTRDWHHLQTHKRESMEAALELVVSAKFSEDAKHNHDSMQMGEVQDLQRENQKLYRQMLLSGPVRKIVAVIKAKLDSAASSSKEGTTPGKTNHRRETMKTTLDLEDQSGGKVTKPEESVFGLMAAKAINEMLHFGRSSKILHPEIPFVIDEEDEEEDEEGGGGEEGEGGEESTDMMTKGRLIVV